jgi:hypothetical protein
MVETTLDILFLGDDEASVVVETTAAGDKAQQAELLSFAHYAARTINVVPHVAHTLGSPEELERFAASLPATNASVRVVARYLNTRRGPRTFFRINAKGDVPERLLPRSLPPLLRRQGLTQAAALMGALTKKGRLTHDNELTAALAVANSASSDRGVGVWDLERCPSCGGPGPFEAVLWPSETAAIRKCKSCSAGIWLRRRRRPRLFPPQTWADLEALRAVLPGGGDQPLLDALRQAFIENRWPFAEVQGAPALVSELSGPQGSWKFYAQAVDEQELVLLYSICPLRVPPERRREVADYITRTNYGLAAGNFELDFTDGELRYKTALHVHGDALDSPLLRRVVRANGLAMETYLAGVGAVIAGTSGSAVAGIENQI